jgi:hypothetical protein
MRISTVMVCVSATLAGNFCSSRSLYASNKVVLGEPLSSEKVFTVDECLQKNSICRGKKIKLTGTVAKVCQSKGCWFALQGKSETTVRITSLGYKFFVPKNSSGMLATVEGVFVENITSAEDAQHFEDDRVKGTSEKPKKISQPVKEFKLEATAVQLN